MSNYVSNQGESIDPKKMNDFHIKNALAKAIKDDNKFNIKILQEEIESRNASK